MDAAELADRIEARLATGEELPELTDEQVERVALLFRPTAARSRRLAKAG